MLCEKLYIKPVVIYLGHNVQYIYNNLAVIIWPNFAWKIWKGASAAMIIPECRHIFADT